MNKSSMIFISICSIVAALLIGCSSSQESSQEQKQPPESPIVTQPTEQPAEPKKELPVKADTVEVKRIETPPVEQPKPTRDVQPPPPVAVVKFVVQIGAYKMPDKIEYVVAQAKERFTNKIYTIKDKETDVTKIFIGDFSSKDEARKFRDQIVRQYPDDYKGAWVSELSHE